MRTYPQGEEKADSALSSQSQDTSFSLFQYFSSFNGHEHKILEDSLLDITLLNEDSNTKISYHVAVNY